MLAVMNEPPDYYLLLCPRHREDPGRIALCRRSGRGGGCRGRCRGFDELVEGAGDGAFGRAVVGQAEGTHDGVGAEGGLADAAVGGDFESVLDRPALARSPPASAATSSTRSVAWLKALPSLAIRPASALWARGAS